MPLASLLAHRWVALAVLLLVLVIGLPLAYKKGQPQYMADASIQVAPRYMRNLVEDPEVQFQSNTQYRQFVEHQSKSFGRYDVLRDALASLGERRNVWQLPNETERQAVERLRARLVVTIIPDTYLLRVSLQGNSSAGLAEVVNAVCTTFIERMKDEQIYGADARTVHLREREKELLGQIDAKGAERSVIAQKLSLTTFNEGTPNPYDQLVSALRGKLAESRQRRMDADAALAAFKNRGDTNVTVRSVQDAVLNDPGLNSLKGSLSARQAALLVQKSGLKPDHPGAIAADRELAEIDREMSAQTQRLESRVRGNLLARLQGTAEQANALERGIRDELDQLESQASNFARLFQDAMALTSDLNNTRAELDKVRERISALSVESTSLGFLRLVNPAMAPETPFGPGRKKLMMMVLLAALAGALGVPILLYMLDRRVHTVKDAQRLMGIEPAGWQVERSDIASQIFGDEQLRRMAAALIRSRDTRQQRVFGFTGCKPGAGTTTLMLELANTLRSLGFTVLAVEANGTARDPRYGSGRPGLVELLRGEARGGDVIAQATATLPVRVAFSGSKRTGAVERIDRLGRALKGWGDMVDFVLVDMPPLLTSADAELLARTVGQVLLVVQAGVLTKDEVQRAKRLLQTIDPDAVGLVVNRISPYAGGSKLRDAMIESITRRPAGAFFSMPPWRLWFASLFTRRSRGRP
jgi:polysaccharide biosynthesis transport protein